MFCSALALLSPHAYFSRFATYTWPVHLFVCLSVVSIFSSPFWFFVYPFFWCLFLLIFYPGMPVFALFLAGPLAYSFYGKCFLFANVFLCAYCFLCQCIIVFACVSTLLSMWFSLCPVCDYLCTACERRYVFLCLFFYFYFILGFVRFSLCFWVSLHA